MDMDVVTTEVDHFLPFRLCSVTEINLPPYMRGMGSARFDDQKKPTFSWPIIANQSVVQQLSWHARNTASLSGNTELGIVIDSHSYDSG
jgi:hypothetical protein